MYTYEIVQNREIFYYGDCKFDRSKFRKLLGFAVRDNHSMFDGKLYDQTDGVAMGSPLGPSLRWLIYLCVSSKTDI